MGIMKKGYHNNFTIVVVAIVIRRHRQLMELRGTNSIHGGP